MEYQSLYRKYRPSDFNDTVGQTVALKILKNSIINNRISHAYLFAGPRGTGKTSFAKIFAKTINCKTPIDGIPCGECVPCQILLNKECVDIIEIDAASNNGVDEIRELRNKVNLVPAELKYKVYIIDEVHMLTTQAFNALLKTLEEPPSHAIFILATTELERVLPTILSRCQVIEFKKISNEHISHRLKYISDLEKINIDEISIREIVESSDGGLRDAIGTLEKMSAYTEKVELKDVRVVLGGVAIEELEFFVSNVLCGNKKEIITSINKHADSGIDIYKFAEDIIKMLKKNILVMDNSNNVSRETLSDENIRSIILNLIEALPKIKASKNAELLLEIAILSSMRDNEKQNITPEEKENKEKVKDDKIEKQSSIKRDEENVKFLELKKLRVANTLAKVDKQQIKIVREKWPQLKNEAFNVEFGSFARLLADDAIPVAASDEYIILTYNSTALATQSNTNLEKIEKTINLTIGCNHKVICLSKEEWDSYILKYKENKDQYTYIKEENESEEANSNLADKAKALFGEV